MKLLFKWYDGKDFILLILNLNFGCTVCCCAAATFGTKQSYQCGYFEPK